MGDTLPTAFREAGLAVGDVLVYGNGFDTTSVAKEGGKGLEHETDGFWGCVKHTCVGDTR